MNYRRYQPERSDTPTIHRWILDTETKYIRGEACATAAAQLKLQGFQPNLICAHPGWGESLFLRDEWPHTPILSYQEFFIAPRDLMMALIQNSGMVYLAGDKKQTLG